MYQRTFARWLSISQGLRFRTVLRVAADHGSRTRNADLGKRRRQGFAEARSDGSQRVVLHAAEKVRFSPRFQGSFRLPKGFSCESPGGHFGDQDLCTFSGDSGGYFGRLLWLRKSKWNIPTRVLLIFLCLRHNCPSDCLKLYFSHGFSFLAYWASLHLLNASAFWPSKPETVFPFLLINQIIFNVINFLHFSLM